MERASVVESVPVGGWQPVPGRRQRRSRLRWLRWAVVEVLDILRDVVETGDLRGHLAALWFVLRGGVSPGTWDAWEVVDAR